MVEDLYGETALLDYKSVFKTTGEDWTRYHESGMLILNETGERIKNKIKKIGSRYFKTTEDRFPWLWFEGTDGWDLFEDTGNIKILKEYLNELELFVEQY